MNVYFSCNITFVYDLVNLGPSYGLISPSHASVSTRVVSMIEQIKSLRSLIFEIYASLKTY